MRVLGPAEVREQLQLRSAAEATDVTAPSALIGGGVIGGGWAARFVENGIDVVVHDPHPEAPRRVRRCSTTPSAPGRLTLTLAAARGPLAASASPARSPRPSRDAERRAGERPGGRGAQAAPARRGRRARSRRRARRARPRRASCRPRLAGRHGAARAVRASGIPSTRSTCCRWSRSSPASTRAPRRSRAPAAFYALARHEAARACAARSTASSPTGCSRRSGARRSGSCTTASRRRRRSTTRSATGRACAGRRWARS